MGLQRAFFRILNTQLEGLVLVQGRSRATGHRSTFVLYGRGDLPGLGLKVRSQQISKIPAWLEFMPHNPASVQRLHRGDHSGGPAGGALAGLWLLLCWDHTESQ